ncbi:MAG: polyphosphate polymerase domain-containing protein [Oscillibacter sp.]|jgi:hypothetical protein|nr:polyphosphate polymerase domain-containing protein [Oscillibacter sp.]
MDDSVFQRHELKYLVGSRQRAFLCDALARRMTPDPYGDSTVCSVYFDTPDFRLIRRSLEKPVYKEKLRLRSYGPANPEQPVFLELKKKFRDTVYKRRISLLEREAAAYLDGAAALPEDSQIGREIEAFRQFYGTLSPAVYLSYGRSACFSPEEPGLRVTFDRDILWRTDRLKLTDAPGGRRLLPPDISLMEIKTAGAVPLWLVRLLSAGKVRQTAFSKYGRAYETILLGANQTDRGVFCA